MQQYIMLCCLVIGGARRYEVIINYGNLLFNIISHTFEYAIGPIPLGTRRCCDVESKSMTLIQRHNNVVCPGG